MESPLIPWALIVFLAGFLLATDNWPHRKLYYLLVFLPFVIALNKSQWQALLCNPIIATTGLLLTYLLLTLFWSPNVDVDVVYDRIRWAILALSFVMVVAFVIHRDPRWHEKLTLVLAPVAIIAATYSIYEFVAQGNTLLDDRLYNAVFYHSSPIRASVPFAVTSLFCAFFLLDRPAAWKATVAGAGLIVCIAFLFLAQSRGLMLATTVGIGAGLVLYGKWTWLVVLAAAGATAIGFTEFINADMRGFLSRADSYRLDIWAATLTRITDAPILGEGLNTSKEIYVPAEDKYFASPHNMFLMAALCGGIIGFALLLAIIAAALGSAVRLRDDPVVKLGIGLLIFGLIHLSVDSHEIIDTVGCHYWLALWLPLAIIASAVLKRHLLNHGPEKEPVRG